MRSQPLVALHTQLVSIDSLLNLAGAKHYTPAEIEAHKAHELAIAPKASRLYAYQPAIDIWVNKVAQFCYMIVLTAILTGAAGVVLAVMFGCAYALTSTDTWPEFLTRIVLAFACTLACVSLVAGLLAWGISSLVRWVGSFTIRGPAKWTPYSVEGYIAKYGLLPEHAMRIVRTVEAFAPHNRPRVQVLENNRVRLDPVLEIVAPDGRFRAVDIWV